VLSSRFWVGCWVPGSTKRSGFRRDGSESSTGEPRTLNSPRTWNPEPGTRNPEPNPEPRTQNLEPLSLLFLDRARLTSAVIPAVRTHTMRRLGFVTVRTLAEANWLQCVVGAALGGPGLGVSSFWIRHRLRTLSCSLANSSKLQTVDLPTGARTGRRRD
jgi:hypothetical protein